MTEGPAIEFEVDGRQVQVPDDGSSLLGALRDHLGICSAKDGCSPQGQCGCCTVLVDGQPRVACVTPARRVAGRTITTLDGFAPAERERWSEAFCAAGASQCGFCTPGIIVRLAGLEAHKPDATDDEVRRALAAHLCRCTGWQTIVEAWHGRNEPRREERDLAAASERASIEGRSPQVVSPKVALGDAGFADDSAPADALVAVLDARGEWVVGPTLHEARVSAGKVQGRRTTLETSHPLDLPPGEWAATLRTSWVEPGYLETDASWAEPSGAATSPLANGGAFGGKSESAVGDAARRLADEHGRPVRVLYSREDSVLRGAKRPPVAGGAYRDGTGLLRVAKTPGVEGAIALVAPGLVVETIELPNALLTSAAIRGAGWVEAVALLTLARGEAARVHSPDGAWAEVEFDDERIRVRVSCGRPLDEIVLRSYCIGAAHMGFSLVTGESLAVDTDGVVHDLTVRSFGITRALDMPHVEVEIVDTEGPAVNGSDAVFAAVTASVALARNATSWPDRR